MLTTPSNTAKTVWIPEKLHHRLAEIARVTGRNIKITTEIALAMGITQIEEQLKTDQGLLIAPNRRDEEP